MIRTICVIVALLIPVTVNAWWAPEWTQRKTLVVNSTATGANLQQALTDVPVLVRLHGGNFPQFLNVRDGGADFRFVAGDDKTPLEYHVERFDPVSQIALVWVKLPVLSPQASEQKFHFYFGNAAAVAGADSGATFDVDTAAVYHFNETSGLPQDSTAYASTLSSGQVIANPASLIGNGIVLAGAEPLIVADAPQLAMTAAKGWTVEMWVKFDALPAAPVYLIDRQAEPQRLSLVANGGQLSASYGGAELASQMPLAAAQWQHVALVLGGGQMQLYVNGAPAGATPVTLADMGGAVYVGGAADEQGLLNVAIDELRIHATARSADAIAFSAAIQGERNGAVVTYGADESAEQNAAGAGGVKHASHFGIIINYVFGKKDAIVEQGVIVLCGLMAAIAIMVMYLKAVALARSRGASDKFLAAYYGAVRAGDERLDSLLDQEERYGDSPLFNVYRQGFAEIRARLSPAIGAAPAGLEDKSLNAIRATLDATMVREGQRLNSLLVLLTIAISGGPFIGLLGTVVGVMVTFAAIAATGDVNIAAIAPGMAAALLATVAGLGVAIPSLFGYNYLSAKAKDISADMHVFADEFLARLNEQYGR